MNEDHHHFEESIQEKMEINTQVALGYMSIILVSSCVLFFFVMMCLHNPIAKINVTYSTFC